MSEIVERLAAAAEARDFSTLESLWLDLLESEEVPADGLAQVLRRLVAMGEGPRALDMAMAMVSELVRAERYAEALPLVRAVAQAAPGNEEVRNALLTCYRRVYGKVPHLGACMDRSGILTQPDLGAAVDVLDRLLSYREGDYFYHPSGWGMGRIAAFDPLTGRATVDLERKPGHQVPIESLEEMLVRLDPESFLVLRQAEPERLRLIAGQDPARLVRMALNALGGRLSARALRELLEGVVLPQGAWAKWWTGARAALKRDPYVEIAPGSNSVLTLRAQAVSYEEEMSRRFASLKDLQHLTEALGEYAEHMGKDADPEAFLLPAARAVAARIASERSPGAAFEAALLLSNLDVDAGPHPTPEEVAERCAAEPNTLLNSLTSNATRSLAFRILRERAADPRQLCCQVLLEGPESLWDAAADGLPEGGGHPNIQSLVGDVLRNPGRRHELFAWVCRNLLLGRWKTGVAPREVFECLLNEGDALARRKAYQRGEWTPFKQEEAIAAIRQSLRAGGLEYFDEMLRDMSETEAARLHFRIGQSSILPEHFARTLEQKMVRRFPKLLVEEEERAESARVEHIYNTPQAIARRRREHDHIVHVLIPKNSQDIAKAKESGDVTDNADFRAAIQEQHVLNAKAIEMGQELQRARPIEPAMVSTEEVSIGSRVTVEDIATGQRRTYSILGPWDSDAEHGIIAYVAPLARALLRRRVGEVVAFAHAGERAAYRIVELGSALEGSVAPDA